VATHHKHVVNGDTLYRSKIIRFIVYRLIAVSMQFQNYCYICNICEQNDIDRKLQIFV